MNRKQYVEGMLAGLEYHYSDARQQQLEDREKRAQQLKDEWYAMTTAERQICIDRVKKRQAQEAKQ